MNRLRLSVCAAVAAALIAVGGIAYAAGIFQGFPTVGGAASGSIPAGPSTLTGAETFPADTNVSGGAGAATVVVTTCQMGAGSKSVDSPAVSVTSKTIPNQICYYIFSGAGTISAFTLTMPSAPLDGQILRISSGGPVVTTLTMSANSGQTLKGAATSISANAAVGAWIYNASDTTWYRVQ